jgi:RNA polymerase sigma-70 factor (ECF subfamily)
MAGGAYRPGDAADFDRLYRDSHRRILATLSAVLGGDIAAAEDCTQDTFVKAYRAWSRWRPDAPAEAWLHRIALNVALTYRRREKLRGAGELVRRLGLPASSPDPMEAGSGSAVVVALRRIPLRLAVLIVLRHHHGYSNREIAAAIGVPETTLGSRLRTAMRLLRAELSREGIGVVTSPRSGVVTEGSISGEAWEST